MKKISLLLVALTVAVSASAGMNLKTDRSVKSNRILPKTEMSKNLVKPKDLKALPAKSRTTKDQPAGVVKEYLRSGDAIFADNSITTGPQSGRMTIVFAEDGKVYMKNLMYNSESQYGENWVEGQLNDDGTEITVPLGQSIYWNDYYGADIVLAWGSTSIEEREDGTYVLFDKDEQVTEVVYTIDGNVIYGPEGIAPVEDDDNPYWSYHATGLGTMWSDDGTFGGFMEWNTVLTETTPQVTPTVITEQPEGQLYTYIRKSAALSNSINGLNVSETDGKVSVVFGENGKVYIQNPMWWYDNYNSWVEGTYDWMTGIITIPTGQFLNWDEYYEGGVQLLWGYTYTYQDGVDPETDEPQYQLFHDIDERTTEIQFLVDGNDLYLLGSAGDIHAPYPEWGNTMGMTGVWSDDGLWSCVEFSQFDEDGHELPFGKIQHTVPTVPANPTADEWHDSGSENGYSQFFYTLPTEDVNGNPLNPEYLSYSIFTDDDQLFTFPAVNYVYDLTYDIDEVPYWLYSNGVDFSDYHTYFYRTNENDNPMFAWRIGIQVYYTVNGERNASDIVYLEVFPHTGVQELNAVKAVASVRYFNVAGQEMAHPEGLTIQVTTYADGTTSTVKVVK